jgi:hypothetical protein
MRCKKSTVLTRLEKAFESALLRIMCEVPTFPVDGCYISCTYTLEKFCGAKGWKVSLQCGTFRGEGHYWLQLSDGTIVDFSFGQFRRWHGMKVVESTDDLFACFRS